MDAMIRALFIWEHHGQICADRGNRASNADLTGTWVREQDPISRPPKVCNILNCIHAHKHARTTQ
eukprot:1388034-Amorphochlora_amoeboformis.AAC.2